VGNGRGRCNAISLSRAFTLDFQLHFDCKVIKEAPRYTLNTEMNNSFFYTDSEMNAQQMWVQSLETTTHFQRLQVHGDENVILGPFYKENS
jgi:hypothetical protein